MAIYRGFILFEGGDFKKDGVAFHIRGNSDAENALFRALR